MTEYPFSPLRAVLFTALAVSVIYLDLLPFQTVAETPVMPDLLVALTSAWVIRRPDSMPLVLIAPIFLLADLALDRPPGLWALLSLLMIEALRAQRDLLRNGPAPVEWASFAAALAVALILQALILRLTLVPRPSGEVTLQLFAVTVVAYPAVVLVLHALLRVRAPKPAERSRRLGRVG